MSTTHHTGVEEPLDTTIARLIMTQHTSRLSPSYQPLIGIPATPAPLAESGWPMMSADRACIEGVMAAGGDVRLLPYRLRVSQEDALEEALHVVLSCDGLLFPGSDSVVDARHYGQEQLTGSASDPLLDQWLMLLMLAARATLTPVFGIDGGAERLNDALGGTMHHQSHGWMANALAAPAWVRQTLLLDSDTLERCLRGASYIPPDDDVLALAEHSIWCLHHQSPERVAPALTAWGWTDDVMKGFGYTGPQPWFALGTLFHPEVDAQEPLSGFLLTAFLVACRAYASSAHHALKAPSLRKRILHHLSADPLVRRVLYGSSHRSPDRDGAATASSTW